MTYQIEILNRAVKQLKKLSTDIRDKINETFYNLLKIRVLAALSS